MGDELYNKLNRFFSQYTLLHYKKREVILRADDTPPGLFFIKNGYVRLYAVSKEGIELTFTILKPGSYFSLIWALGGLDNVYYFEALTAVEVYRAPRVAVLDFLKQEPDILFWLTQRILRGLNGMLHNMEALLFGKAYDKVVSILLVLAQRFGQATQTGEVIIPLPLTHHDLATMTGLTRETTSLQINQLEKAGLIDNIRHSLVIKDMDALMQKAVSTTEETTSPSSL